MATLLMARLLTRPDQASSLAAFLTWALDSLQIQGVDGSFIVPGLLLKALMLSMSFSLDAS